MTAPTNPEAPASHEASAGPTSPAPLRALGYVRTSTSTGAQAADGTSLANQQTAIEREADYRGYILAEVVTDNGHSGGTLARPGLERALVTLADHRAEVLVAARLDRLSRSVADFTHLIARANREGWHLSVLDLGLDTASPQGRFLAHILAAVAELERDIIRTRTREALAAKRAAGIRLGRPPSIDAATRALITEAAGRGLSLRAIVAELEASGVPTSRGGRWHASTVGRVLAEVAS